MKRRPKTPKAALAEVGALRDTAAKVSARLATVTQDAPVLASFLVPDGTTWTNTKSLRSLQRKHFDNRAGKRAGQIGLAGLATALAYSPAGPLSTAQKENAARRRGSAEAVILCCAAASQMCDVNRRNLTQPGIASRALTGRAAPSRGARYAKIK